MRMIDADELIRNLEGIISDYTSNGIYPEKFGVDDFIDVVKAMPTLPAPQWIRVEDEKPDIGQYVLVYHKDGNMQCAQCSRSGYDDRDLWGLDYYYEGQKEITHWMPLPEPPKEGHHEY